MEEGHQAPQAPESKKKGRRGRIILIVLIVLAALGFIFPKTSYTESFCLGYKVSLTHEDDPECGPRYDPLGNVEGWKICERQPGNICFGVFLPF